MVHRKPRLNFDGRQLIIARREAGWSSTAVAEAQGFSRATVHKWWRRYQAEGLAGLADRSCRPHTSPRQLKPQQEATLLELRRIRRLGPHRLALLTKIPRSTCYQVLRRHQLHRLDGLDRPTGRLVRRYERSQPGELGHMDVKKLARIPEGGGHWVHGRKGRPRREREKRTRVGFDFVHSLLDDHSRLAYTEQLGDETAATVGVFFRRAVAWFAERGVHFQAVMTDNAWAYRNGRDYHQALSEIGARPVFIPPYTPRINGKVERYNRTLLEEWAYHGPYLSNYARHRLLKGWLHRYNYHRVHTAVGGPPIQRVNSLCGSNTLRGAVGVGVFREALATTHGTERLTESASPELATGKSPAACSGLLGSVLKPPREARSARFGLRNPHSSMRRYMHSRSSTGIGLVRVLTTSAAKG